MNERYAPALDDRLRADILFFFEKTPAALPPPLGAPCGHWQPRRGRCGARRLASRGGGLCRPKTGRLPPDAACHRVISSLRRQRPLRQRSRMPTARVHSSIASPM